MRAALVLVALAVPALAQDGGSLARGVDGPVTGTQCFGPDDCLLDGTTCSTDAGVSTWPAPKEGPACGCVAKVCHYVFIEPVSCARDADCALSTEPVLHPVKAAPAKQKAKPFRPCKDGERQAICDAATKRCTIRTWKC